MKLVVIAPAYYPSSGGVEKHIRMVCRELKKLGWDITIFVRFATYLPRHQKIDGITVIRLPKYLPKSVAKLWIRRYKTVFKNVDVIHSHDYFPWSLRGLLADTAWVHTFHGYEGYPLTAKALRVRAKIRSLVSQCVGVGKFIEKWYHTPCDLITYGGVEVANVGSTTPKWDAVFVGRLEIDTGFADYMKGFRLAAQKRPKLRLAIVGSGALEDWAKSFAAKHQLLVDFKGTVAEVEQYLAQTKVAFVSGYLTILEAAVLDKPVVAHYNTPIKEDYLRFHPMSSYFQIVNTPAQISAALTKIINNPRQYPNAKFKYWAKKQTWGYLARQYQSIYQKELHKL